MNVLDQLSSPLLQRALLEAVLVGALCGAVGAHVLLRRLPFFTLALSHATFPGVAIASLLGVSLFLGGIVAALTLVAVVALVGSARQLDSATATGIALSAAFAIGVLVQSAGPGASKDLTAFLVGDLFTVDRVDVVTTVVVGALVLSVLAVLHKELVFSAFDPAGAEAAGYPTLRLELLVLVVVALTVVTSVPAVGTILVITLLVAPALAARFWTDSIATMMVMGAAFGASSGCLGVLASAQWGIAGGAATTMAAVIELAVSATAHAVLGVLRAPSPRSVEVVTG